MSHLRAGCYTTTKLTLSENNTKADLSVIGLHMAVLQFVESSEQEMHGIIERLKGLRGGGVFVVFRALCTGRSIT